MGRSPIVGGNWKCVRAPTHRSTAPLHKTPPWRRSGWSQRGPPAAEGCFWRRKTHLVTVLCVPARPGWTPQGRVWHARGARGFNARVLKALCVVFVQNLDKAGVEALVKSLNGMDVAGCEVVIAPVSMHLDKVAAPSLWHRSWGFRLCRHAPTAKMAPLDDAAVLVARHRS